MSSPLNTKKILILGATGPLGLLTVKEALLRNFEITVYVRNPEKLPAEMKENKSITVRFAANMLSLLHFIAGLIVFY
jgi:uncharacterized protein YbjT (DUF2867 family)